MDKKTFTDKNETGCCPVFDPKPWDESEVTWHDKLFVKDSVICLMHIPLGMNKFLPKMFAKIKEAGAEVPTNEFLWLAHDPSPWRGDHYISVSKEIPGMENVRISGTFLTKVFDGSYNQAGKWYKEMLTYVESKGKKSGKVYFFYTCCPKCAKHYGHNYVVAFAQV